MLVVDLHVKYIQELDTKKDTFEYWAGEHLRMNGVYWGITALHLLRHADALNANEITEYVFSCQHPNRHYQDAFGGHVGHDPHLLYTLSAVQILATVGELDNPRLDKEKIATYIQSLQNEDGSFSGDEFKEVDTRFSYCAISCLSLLGFLRAPYIDIPKATAFLSACRNFDGGYGSVPGAESHSGQIFCCVGALAILNRLDLVETDKLCWWLAERQLPNGGLNGRPEKLEDVCYSWWVLSCLSILDRAHWINGDKLIQFILRSQDVETGGIADRPGDVADVFHTLFGIAGLSLLGYEGLDAVDPRYCMPTKVLRKIGIKGQP